MSEAIFENMMDNDIVETETYEEKENIIKCKIKIDRIFFPKDYYKAKDGDFYILKATPEEVEMGVVHTDAWGNISLKGNCPKLDMTETYCVTAKEVIDPKWGKQYNIMFINRPVNLDDKEKQRIFLEKILATSQVSNLYKVLENPFEAIKNQDVESLIKAKGIGTTTALKIINKYNQTIDYSEAYVELDSYGLTNKTIEKICDSYGSPDIAVGKIKENPYIIADEMDGIGFIKADKIALKMGIGENSPARIKAFIKAFLNAQAYEGNSWVSPSDLMSAILDILGDDIDREVLRECLYDMPELWWNDSKTKIGLKRYYNLERAIASELLRIKTEENTFVYDKWQGIIKEREEIQGWDYTNEQIEGIKAVLENQVVLITGYGGTGKSSIVSGMLDVFNGKYSFANCALSGKASANLAEITQTEGKTIHRLLEFDPQEGGFIHNEENPLDEDIIILDEISMVDANLFLSLLKAIRSGAKLIMLGDAGQLPSIGVGNIMIDIMESGVIKSVTLTKIHRQASKSAIITEAQKVRKQEQLIDKGYTGIDIRGELQDLELNIYNDKDKTAPYIVEYFKKHLKRVKNIMELQVVLPMKSRGEACTFKLNNQLQDIYNPFDFNTQEVEISLSKDAKYKLRLGDKVVNRKNNYKTYNTDGKKTPVFNGNVGIITSINFEDRYITVDYKGIGEVIMPKDTWNNIELAYAMTCHSLQGSSADIVIVGLDYSSYKLLSKEWLYTALTRAKKYCILCAENRALRYTTEVSSAIAKQTHLQTFLLETNE